MRISTRWKALLVCALVVTGCRNPLGFDKNVRLVITDLVVPESASAGTSFIVRLTAVSGGCVGFDRLIATRQTGTLTLEARGTDGGGPGISCTTDIRTDLLTHEASPPFSNPFTVSALLPDGSSVTRTVRIQ